MNKQKQNVRIFLLLMLAVTVVLLPSYTFGQVYFGKNKVQYTKFDWQVMTTEHFKIYFYTAEKEVASIAARSAEDSYRLLAQKFNHEVLKKIPLIIYSSPSFFSQTNVISGMLPESVGGFTEFLKGRVVVPFHGSYYDFDHVIRHELVHVFTLSKRKHVTERRTRVKSPFPPLWFTEGLAECWSKDWDTEADMITKDMILNDMFFPIDKLYIIRGSFYMYKLGESICRFIESAYGPDKITKIFENWYKGDSFDDIITVTLGENLSQVSKKWEYFLKKKYYPELDSLDLPDMKSERISKDGYNVKGVPIRYDDGSGESDWVVYKANRYGYAGIYMKPLNGSKKTKTLLKGESSSEFESLHLLRSGIDVYDNNFVAFSSKSKENDVLYIYDIAKSKVTRRYEMDSLVAVRSPRFSHDGRQIVFSGVRKNGYTDLYLLNLADSSYAALTDDYYYDIDPVFTIDDMSIVFSSDRGKKGQEGIHNLFNLNIQTSEISQITFGSFKDMSPEVSNNGIYFASNRCGTYNLFLLNKENEIKQLSTFVTGAFDPRLTKDEKTLVYSGYQKMSFNIYSMKLPKHPKQVKSILSYASASWYPKKINSEYEKTSMKYDNDYSIDIAQSSIGYDPVYGSIGGIQAAISDVLGNRSIYLLLANTAQTKDDFLESFNVGITYLQREKRMNWGIGAFHLYNEYYNDYDELYFERQAGIISLFSYPFSKFHRLDFTTLIRYTKKEILFGSNVREKVLATNYISWVFDNSLWDISGPIEGRRYNLSFGITSSLSDMSHWNRLVSVDIRHYLRLGKYSAFANRLFAFSSSGQEPQRIYFGGSWSFRGYDRRSFYNRNVIFASNELRFPLINNLNIGFPFGGGIGFRGIRGALFFDVGSAWDNNYDKMLGSFGAGVRVPFANIILLRFDFSRTTDFHTVSNTTDFDFFFGWNF